VPVSASRTQAADDLLRRLAALLRSGQLYARDHPVIQRNLDAMSVTLEPFFHAAPSVVIGIVGEDIIVNDLLLSKVDGLAGLVRRLKHLHVERVTIDRGVTLDELATMAAALATAPPTNGGSAEFPSLPHVRVGRVSVGQRTEEKTADLGAFKRLYNEAVSAAEGVWECARAEGMPDATVARTMVDDLAQAVSQNRSLLLALTTLKNYDNYTFTHMVNVSILTMGQARALGIDGALLREFGLAALMHDIGKVRTPLEILQKPERLTDDEFAIMKRHTVDGAEILRTTPDIPTLAPVVAFEHHLRIDGSGYPHGITRRSLNLGTMLCSVADVYDAMRSQRSYQKAFPSDRILKVLKQSDGQQFDRHLVRRFSQLVGIYPVGNLVRLDTGETAVVVKVHAPDPRRPHVRVAMDRSGRRLEAPFDLHLWETLPGCGSPASIVAPVDPADAGLDPLTLL
jgi:putative nucleotidyltransferase with HDIG domain